MGYRIVRMSQQLFNEIMTEGRTFPPVPGRRIRVVKGLPEGAKLEQVSMDLWMLQGDVALRYSHSSWPETAPGVAVPILDVQFVTEDIVSDRDLTPVEEELIHCGKR